MAELLDIAKADGYSKYRATKSVTSDYDIVLTDDTLVVAATTADITLTLPLLSSIQSGIYQILNIIPIVANGYKVRIITQGADTFPFGNTWFDLPRSQKQFEIGLGQHGFNLRRNISVVSLYHRPASWAASNFSTATAIPLAIETKNTQTEIIQWGEDGSGSVNPNRVYVHTAGSYYASFGLDIDSTGGSTWNVTAQIYVNGSPITYADVTTGNYGGEDQSLTFLPILLELSTDDYVEIFLVQTNLTGSLSGCTFNLNIRL